MLDDPRLSFPSGTSQTMLFGEDGFSENSSMPALSSSSLTVFPYSYCLKSKDVRVKQMRLAAPEISENAMLYVLDLNGPSINKQNLQHNDLPISEILIAVS